MAIDAIDLKTKTCRGWDFFYITCKISNFKVVNHLVEIEGADDWNVQDDQ